MIALVLAIAAIVTAGLGLWLLRRSGSAWRVGRLLAVAPRRSLAQAVAMAAAGEQRYVRIHGRIDSDEEFPGDDDKPLVFRRRRLERLVAGGAWAVIDETREAVPFGLAEKGERIEIDHDALGDGLVAVPRFAEGVASDVPEAAWSDGPVELPADAPVRLRIDQLSSVDHATAAGVPVSGEDGAVLLTAGLRRPLIVTPLDPDEAMRVLGSGRRPALIAGGVLLLVGFVLGIGAIVAALVG